MELQTSDRQSPRLRGYDYASAGAYFVTICTYHRKYIFGTIEHSSVNLTTAGQIAVERWCSLPDQYSYVRLDEWILMPNHLHAIIVLETDSPKPLGSLIGAYKTVSTKLIREVIGSADPIWQRNFHEHIIRSEKSLNGIRQYIVDNPVKWVFDRENLNNQLYSV